MVVALAVALAPVISEPATVTATEALSADQRFVPDVVAQFDDLGLRPDGLGFDIGSSPDPTYCKHYQGMARKDGADGTPYLFITRSGNVPFPCPDPVDVARGDEPGSLMVVRMGSRERTGERLRSNRLAGNSAVGYDPTTLNTPPDTRDAVVTTITFDGGATWPADRASTGWPAYGHPGGMQLIGDVLAIGMEKPYEGAASMAVLFLDVSDPETPRFLSVMYPTVTVPGAIPDDFGAGTIGITSLRAEDGACCTYLMVVTGSSNRVLGFYRSMPTGGGTTTDLGSPSLAWIPVEDYTESQLETDDCLGHDVDWPSGSGEGHQTLNFVRQGSLDGALFLVGARNNVPGGFGDDMLELYRVRQPLTSGCPFSRVRSKRMTSYPAGGLEDSANFATASGVYVSPSGELIFYSSDYANSGPAHSSLFVEYRNRNVVRPDSPTLRPTASIDGPFGVDEGSSITLTGSGAPPLTQAWIQLFEDTGAGATIPGYIGALYDSDWWLAVDYADRNADDFGDLDALDHDDALGFDIDFEENADSWRWFAPVGCTILANDYPIGSDEWPGPDTVRLVGTGQVEEDTDLHHLPVYTPPGTTVRISPVPAGQQATADADFDDDVGGVTFGADCDAYYGAPTGLAWDLDGDGTYETAGTSVPFSAATLDGPTTAALTALAQHPTDPTPLGTGDPVPVSVDVRNVAPLIATAALTDSLGSDVGPPGTFVLAGLPVTLDISFTDPGVADTQTASVDWSDGTVDTAFDSFSDAQGGALGRLEQEHTFARPGTFDVVATVTDDDGGATTTTITVRVLSPADAIEAVADQLTALLASATDPAVADALRNARDALIGNLGGSPPTNGALDKLEADDPVGAITKLRAAVSSLQLAESLGAVDLSALKNVLGLVAEAIATAALVDAQAAVAPPSPGEERALARIVALIALGHAQLGSGQHLDAFGSFRQAVSRALDLIR